MGDGQGALQSALTHSVSRQRRPSCSPAHSCSTTSPWLFVTPLAAGRCACHTTGTRIGITEGSFRSPRCRCNLVAHRGRRFNSPPGFSSGRSCLLNHHLLFVTPFRSRSSSFHRPIEAETSQTVFGQTGGYAPREWRTPFLSLRTSLLSAGSPASGPDAVASGEALVAEHH